MNCPACTANVPDGSAFCNSCGGAMSTPPAGTPAVASPASPLHAAAGAGAAGAGEPERDLWKGRFSAKARAHHFFFWIVWAVAVAYLWWGVLGPDTRAHAAAFWVVAGAVLIPFLWIGWGILVEKFGVRYRLTNHRLFRERGIVSRQVDEIELIRVDDVSVRQNILQRVFNVGVVTVIAPTDPTEPKLEIYGIANPIEVKEQIRTHVRKRRDRSLHVESL